MTTPLISLYASTLNALDEMQHSIAYAARRPVLAEAERLIVTLDTENTALRAQLEASMQRQEQLASNVNAGLLEIRSLTALRATIEHQNQEHNRLLGEMIEMRAETERLRQERDEWKAAAQMNNGIYEPLQQQLARVTQERDAFQDLAGENLRGWEKAQSLLAAMTQELRVEKHKAETNLYEANKLKQQLDEFISSRTSAFEAYKMLEAQLTQAQLLLATRTQLLELEEEKVARLTAQLAARMQERDQYSAQGLRRVQDFNHAIDTLTDKLATVATALAGMTANRDDVIQQGLATENLVQHWKQKWQEEVRDRCTAQALRNEAQAKLTETAPCGHPKAWYAVDDDANDHCIGCQAQEARERVTRLEEALEKIAKPALGGKQQQWIAQQALREEGEDEPTRNRVDGQ